MSGTLEGKTLFITGASRGIGLAIALRAARDGANIVVAAKTDRPHPKLPGTIHTAAAEIEAAGGTALPIVVDIREEEVVAAAVEAAVARFGGIDILVNNASAISLTGTLETPMKRYDLMHAVNVRGTFLCSQKCIPHLKRASNPHILNISPPLSMEAKWFAPHVAYTMAKYGMSLCALGMHEELRGFGIACNTLWPKTAIDTEAIRLIMSQESRRHGRRRARHPGAIESRADGSLPGGRGRAAWARGHRLFRLSPSRSGGGGADRRLLRLTAPFCGRRARV